MTGPDWNCTGLEEARRVVFRPRNYYYIHPIFIALWEGEVGR